MAKKVVFYTVHDFTQFIQNWANCMGSLPNFGFSNSVNGNVLVTFLFTEEENAKFQGWWICYTQIHFPYRDIGYILQ